MDKDIENIYRALEANDAPQAHRLTQKALDEHAECSELYYLKGKAYMKQSDWGNAMSCFLRAEEIDPDSPARECRRMLTDIMDFYNKDMYNQ